MSKEAKFITVPAMKDPDRGTSIHQILKGKTDVTRILGQAQEGCFHIRW